MWCNGWYLRWVYGTKDGGDERVKILRYKCCFCGHTVGVLPEFLAPYKRYSLWEISRIFYLYFIICVNVHLICASLLSASESAVRGWIRDWDLTHKYMLLKGFAESGIATAREIASQMRHTCDSREAAFTLCVEYVFAEEKLRCRSLDCGEYVFKGDYRECVIQRCREILPRIQMKLQGLSPPVWLFRNNRA